MGLMKDGDIEKNMTMIIRIEQNLLFIPLANLVLLGIFTKNWREIHVQEFCITLHWGIPESFHTWMVWIVRRK